MNPLPKVSMIIPCYQEEAFIADVIRDIQGQDYSGEAWEALFVDGGSTDKTKIIIQSAAQKDARIRLLHNPEKFVPHAMNLGIREARGNIIIRLDAHAGYPPNYVRDLVQAQSTYSADNVGGIWETKPRNESLKAQAIASVLAHRMGVGNAQFRLGIKEPKEVDTVPFGCFPKAVFSNFGYYDERLHRNQDIELNKRIVRQGGRIMLIPGVYSIYYARENWSKLWKNNFANGKWVILAANITRTLSALSLRHFIPLGFVVYWLLVIGLFFTPLFHSVFLLPGMVYILLLVMASLQLSQKAKNISLFPFLFVSFVVLHTSYGLGSLSGLTNLFKKSSSVQSTDH